MLLNLVQISLLTSGFVTVLLLVRIARQKFPTFVEQHDHLVFFAEDVLVDWLKRNRVVLKFRRISRLHKNQKVRGDINQTLQNSFKEQENSNDGRKHLKQISTPIRNVHIEYTFALTV